MFACMGRGGNPGGPLIAARAARFAAAARLQSAYAFSYVVFTAANCLRRFLGDGLRAVPPGTTSCGLCIAQSSAIEETPAVHISSANEPQDSGLWASSPWSSSIARRAAARLAPSCWYTALLFAMGSGTPSRRSAGAVNFRSNSWFALSDEKADMTKIQY